MNMIKTTIIQEATNDLLNLLDIPLAVNESDSSEDEIIDGRYIAGYYEEEEFEEYEHVYSSPRDPYGLSKSVSDDPEDLATAYMNLGWD